MKDLIYRQAAINAIENTECELLPCEWDELMNAIRQLPSAQQWIPVTEWLPKEKVEVLVTVEVDGKKYIESGMLLSINHGQWETIYDRYVIDVYGRNRNSKVIAWMPLPEPFEGGDANESKAMPQLREQENMED